MSLRCAYLPVSGVLSLVRLLLEQLLQDVHVQLQLVPLLSGQTLRLQPETLIQLPASALLLPELLLLLALLLQPPHVLLLQLETRQRPIRRETSRTRPSPPLKTERTEDFVHISIYFSHN